MKLFKITTDNNKTFYTTANEDYDAGEKVRDFLKQKYFGGQPINIRDIEELADSETSNLPKYVI